jgi:hypothetical protein
MKHRTVWPVQHSKDKPERTSNEDGTTVAGQSGCGIWERTTETEQPGQDREDKPGHDSNTRTAASEVPWTRFLGRTTGTGQPGRDS